MEGGTSPSAPAFTCDGSASTCTTLCPQGHPLPAPRHAQTATIALLPWRREGQGHLINIAQVPGYKGKDSRVLRPLLRVGHLS